MATIVLTGGGSGGHVIPIIALLDDIKKNFENIYFVGSDGIEKQLMKNTNVEYFEINAIGLNRSNVLKNVKIPFVLTKSVCDEIKFFKKIKPDIIFSKGGYVSVPSIIAGKILSIPIVSHESDISIGLANKIAHKFGAKILVAFDKTATLSKDFEYVGFPIRQNILTGDKNKIYKKFNLDSSKKTLLVLGGSLGASSINEVIYSAIYDIAKNYNVLHITGKNKGKNLDIKNYRQIDYVDNIGDFYSASDIIISRAGAGTLFEISLLNKSVILIPLPMSSSRGDQIENAEYAKKLGAYVLEQNSLNKNTLMNAINNANSKLMPISKIGNEKILDILTTFANDNK